MHLLLCKFVYRGTNNPLSFLKDKLLKVNHLAYSQTINKIGLLRVHKYFIHTKGFNKIKGKEC
jgi:hypothetical protein